MAIKVFLSHQKVDFALAIQIGERLKTGHRIDCYLDVIDPYVGGPVETLADHIRYELGKCTQLLAVVSLATNQSQWVPWEIGVATEKNFPLATFSANNAMPPEFLRKWPYLRSDRDVDEYARVSKIADNLYVQKSVTLNESVAHDFATKDFFRVLRSALGQG
jgi:hypothetical protein